jgi:hypothetical protein
MIAWLIGAITLILIVLIIGRRFSSAIRRKTEEPKYQFLANIGVDLHTVKELEADDQAEQSDNSNLEGKL